MASAQRKFFSFTSTTQAEIAKRQSYLCAVCGTNLGAGNTSILVNYHHVIGVQSANPSNSAHAFIRTSINGVMVCDTSEDRTRSESCHGLVAHGQSHFAGFSAYADAFPYSHGAGGASAHQHWARLLGEKARLIFSG